MNDWIKIGGGGVTWNNWKIYPYLPGTIGPFIEWRLYHPAVQTTRFSDVYTAIQFANRLSKMMNWGIV